MHLYSFPFQSGYLGVPGFLKSSLNVMDTAPMRYLVLIWLKAWGCTWQLAQDVIALWHNIKKVCGVTLDVSRRRLHERAIVNFKLLVIEQIPQEDHTGDCLKELSLTFKLLLIEQITGEIGWKISDS